VTPLLDEAVQRAKHPVPCLGVLLDPGHDRVPVRVRRLQEQPACKRCCSGPIRRRGAALGLPYTPARLAGVTGRWAMNRTGKGERFRPWEEARPVVERRPALPRLDLQSAPYPLTHT
jgi:hypothetical protein